MSVSTNDLKNGMTLDLDGTLFQVVEFQHVKPGKGGAFVRVSPFTPGCVSVTVSATDAGSSTPIGTPWWTATWAVEPSAM